MTNYAVAVLDATGSMKGQENRVVSSMNEYAAALPPETYLIVFMFDSNRWDKFFEDDVSNGGRWSVVIITQAH